MAKICVRCIYFTLFICLILSPLEVQANNVNKDNIYEERMNLYKKIETITQIPWFYIAAIDQYERNVRKSRNDIPDHEGGLGIYFTDSQWVGPLNPNTADTNPLSIGIMGGIGLDGNNDGKADKNDPEDALYSLATYLLTYGFDEDNLKIALWHYYKRDQSVNIINGFAKLYKNFGLKLDENAFPVPLRSNYDYRSTWGASRGWGGIRIHEGTDIFANYGVPVRATTYGIIELKGWNRYGGWRIGIRDINNVYHYFAHLTGFEKGVYRGAIVKPGQIVGYVGSSGYGPPGTQGKFPPHLHYGMYKDNGITEWSFDPYPLLKKWEREERFKNKK